MQACGCDTFGSVRVQCDAHTGHCTCREGFQGDHCTSCSPGYYGFPRCQRCDCHLAGTVEAQCDVAKGYCFCDDSGQCPCKVNELVLHLYSYHLSVQYSRYKVLNDLCLLKLLLYSLSMFAGYCQGNLYSSSWYMALDGYRINANY